LKKHFFYELNGYRARYVASKVAVTED